MKRRETRVHDVDEALRLLRFTQRAIVRAERGVTLGEAEPQTGLLGGGDLAQSEAAAFCAIPLSLLEVAVNGTSKASMSKLVEASPEKWMG